MMAKFKERLAVSRQTIHKFYVERFNLRILKELEGKEQYRVQISKSFVSLLNIKNEVDINKA
jgi:ABC-type hemin transport system ATPase subunit